MSRQKTELDRFNSALDRLLKADPAKVKAGMEREKREREEEAKRTGKRGRGRPPKGKSAKGAE
jgi:hypothetical protein